MFKKIGEAFKSLFTDSEEERIEDNLEDFSLYLTDNVLAQNAANRLVSNLEAEEKYTADEIEDIVESRMPKIIQLVRKNHRIMGLAEQSSGVVVSRDNDIKDLTKSVKREFKRSKDKSEDSELSRQIQRLIEIGEGKTQANNGAGELRKEVAELRELLSEPAK